MSDDRFWKEVDPLSINGQSVYPLREHSRPWTIRMFAFIVEQGGRARKEEVLAVGMPLVPPGIAFRDAERTRLRQREGDQTLRTEESKVERAILTGQRAKCVDSIEILMKTGRLTKEVDADGVTWYVINAAWRPKKRGPKVSETRSTT